MTWDSRDDCKALLTNHTRFFIPMQRLAWEILCLDSSLFVHLSYLELSFFPCEID